MKIQHKYALKVRLPLTPIKMAPSWTEHLNCDLGKLNIVFYHTLGTLITFVEVVSLFKMGRNNILYLAASETGGTDTTVLADEASLATSTLMCEL